MTDVPRYDKPLPVFDQFNTPFWSGTKHGELRMQRCSACGHLRYPPGPVCTRCLSDTTEWVVVSGHGEVFSLIVFHQVYDAAFQDDVPYNVALIKLDEGPLMFSNVVETPGIEAKVGDHVEVVFDEVTPDVTIPRFRIAQG